MIFFFFLATVFAVSSFNFNEKNKAIINLKNLEKVWVATSGLNDFQTVEVIDLIVGGFPKEEFLRPVYLAVIEAGCFLPGNFSQSGKKIITGYFRGLLGMAGTQGHSQLREKFGQYFKEVSQLVVFAYKNNRKMLLNCLFAPNLFPLNDYLAKDKYFTQYFGLPGCGVEEFELLCQNAKLDSKIFFAKFVSAQDQAKRAVIFKEIVCPKLEFLFSESKVKISFLNPQVENLEISKKMLFNCLITFMGEAAAKNMLAKESFEQGNLENCSLDDIFNNFKFDLAHSIKLSTNLCTLCKKSAFPRSLAYFIKKNLNSCKILKDCNELVELDEVSNSTIIECDDANNFTFIGNNEPKYKSSHFQDKVFEEVMKQIIAFTSDEFIKRFDWATKNDFKDYFHFVLSTKEISHDFYLKIQTYNPENFILLPGESLSEIFFRNFLDVCCKLKINKEKFYQFLANHPNSIAALIDSEREYFYLLANENAKALK